MEDFEGETSEGEAFPVGEVVVLIVADNGNLEDQRILIETRLMS